MYIILGVDFSSLAIGGLSDLLIAEADGFSSLDNPIDVLEITAQGNFIYTALLVIN